VSTSRQIFEASLIELNKVQAPSLLLEDYNYFINKAVNQYINKVYNGYEIDQQRSDDLRVLKGTAVLTPNLQTSYPTVSGSPLVSNSKLFGATYETYLPDDYLHVLNCIAEYTVNKQFKCYDAGSTVHFGVSRLTSDMFSQIINNYYMRPSYKKPYYFIDNVNISNTFPTVANFVDINHNTITYSLTPTSTVIANNSTIIINGVTFTFKTTLTIPAVANEILIAPTPPIYVPYTATQLTMENLYSSLLGSDNPLLTSGRYDITHSGSSPFVISINTIGEWVITVPTDTPEPITLTSVINGDTGIERQEPLRYGNKSKVRMEIRYGKDNTLFELTQLYVDYIKAPQYIRLTQDEVDAVEDNSQMLEFPDYVVQEIINELVKLLLENSSDQRLQTNIPINNSIANPQQEEQPQQSRRRK